MKKLLLLAVAASTLAGFEANASEPSGLYEKGETFKVWPPVEFKVAGTLGIKECRGHQEANLVVIGFSKEFGYLVNYSFTTLLSGLGTLPADYCEDEQKIWVDPNYLRMLRKPEREQEELQRLLGEVKTSDPF